MKRFTTFQIIVYLTTAVIMLCAELGFAQTEWIKHPENPVLDVGPSGWESQWVAYGSVILDNGIYDTKGQPIRTLNLGSKNPGVYTTKDRAAYWNGRDSSGQPVASGAYFYTLRAGEFRSTRKMVIVK